MMNDDDDNLVSWTSNPTVYRNDDDNDDNDDDDNDDNDDNYWILSMICQYFNNDMNLLLLLTNAFVGAT